MIRRRKLLEIAAESPASGARFVGRPFAFSDIGQFNLSSVRQSFSFLSMIKLNNEKNTGKPIKKMIDMSG